MRASRITLFASLILSVGAGHAYAQTEVAAYSLFGGTVTQAPDGNIFGVTVGAPILGEIFFPAYPVPLLYSYGMYPHRLYDHANDWECCLPRPSLGREPRGVDHVCVSNPGNRLQIHP